MLPWAQPRIIALTAAASGADRDACQSAGMDDYLPKPIRVEALVAAMRGVAPAAASAATSRAQAPVLDRQVLRALLGQLGRDENDGGELVEEFLTECATGLDRLRQAMDGGDPAAVARIAHEIRPTCALFGAAELAGLLTALETGKGPIGSRQVAIGHRADAGLQRLRAALVPAAVGVGS